MNKLKIFIPAVLVVLLASCGTVGSLDGYDNDDNYRRYDERRGYYGQQPNFNQFYNELSSYGNWVNYPGLGQVWQVNDPFFRPFVTNGQWAHSPYGWTWISNYSWGATPFHYGSWAYDNFYGWMWVPGYQWAPARVMWRSYNGYYGWAPMMAGNYSGYSYWNFVPQRYLTAPQVSQHTVQQPTQVQQLFESSTPIEIKGSTGLPAGPRLTEVKAVAETPVKVIDKVPTTSLQVSPSNGTNNDLQISDRRRILEQQRGRQPEETGAAIKVGPQKKPTPDRQFEVEQRMESERRQRQLELRRQQQERLEQRRAEQVQQRRQMLEQQREIQRMQEARPVPAPPVMRPATPQQAPVMQRPSRVIKPM